MGILCMLRKSPQLISMVLLCFQLKLTEAAAQVDFTDAPQKQCLFALQQ